MESSVEPGSRTWDLRIQRPTLYCFVTEAHISPVKWGLIVEKNRGEMGPVGISSQDIQDQHTKSPHSSPLWNFCYTGSDVTTLGYL